MDANELYKSLNDPSLAPQYSCTKQTRARSKEFTKTGTTTGCYSMQQFIMIRLALFSLFEYIN